MKQLLFFLFFACTQLGYSQDVTLDSTWIALDPSDSLFYQHRLINYDNGGYTYMPTLVGDSAAVGRHFQDQISTSARSMATDSKAVEGFNSKITEFNQIGG